MTRVAIFWSTSRRGRRWELLLQHSPHGVVDDLQGCIDGRDDRPWPVAPPTLTSMTTPSTDTAILDATLETLADVGLGGLSLEDVAQRAGVSRQTLYRYFGNRSALISAAILREEERLMQEVMVATAGLTGLREALSTALFTLLTWTRDHPLLRRLLDTEPEGLLPLLASGDAMVLRAARSAIIEVLGDRLPAGADSLTAADLLARVMLSYAINPPAGAPAVVADALAELITSGLRP